MPRTVPVVPIVPISRAHLIERDLLDGHASGRVLVAADLPDFVVDLQRLTFGVVDDPRPVAVAILQRAHLVIAAPNQVRRSPRGAA